jgi:hypothetical protein
MTKRDKNKLCQKNWYSNNKEKARQYVRDRRADRRIWFDEIVSKLSCKECGENHPATIDFHHRDPLTKVDEVGEMLGKLRSKESILLEIDKCDVYCANCHRKHHYKERNEL